MQKTLKSTMFLLLLAILLTDFSNASNTQEDQLLHHKKLCDTATDPETKKIQCTIYENLLAAYWKQKQVLEGTPHKH